MILFCFCPENPCTIEDFLDRELIVSSCLSETFVERAVKPYTLLDGIGLD